MRVHFQRTLRPSRAIAYSLQRRAFSSSRQSQAQWGFIGLGQMGYNMAKNLQSKLPLSDTLRIYDVNSDALNKFVNEAKSSSSGAQVVIASNVKEAADDAETTITVLPEPQHVKAVFAQILRPEAPSPHPDRLFIDCSTIDPTTSQAVARAVQSTSSGTFVDAPMSGGVVGAKAGTLTFMLGSPAELVPTIEPILLKMGKRVLHCGPQGSGLSGKLANNYLLAINNIATAEAMNLGIKWGLDPKVLAGILNVSTGRCWPSEINNPVPGVISGAPAERDYTGGFGISLMKKDLGLAIQAAEEAGAKLELAGKAKAVYDDAEARDDCKGRDFSVVYRYLGGKE
ncbi:3-hydroxyisobutyrate dehydrogenase-like protein [Xylogone sp. PMI_703]|nr:3-hydroxyisobutyrate dehydrogenase-like protein [Xylogone sp. PMI_703]